MRGSLQLLVVIFLAGCARPGADPAAAIDAASAPTAGSSPGSKAAPSTPSGPTGAPSTENATLSPWNLTAQTRLGWRAAIGAGTNAAATGQSDAEYCPDAAFELPAGAVSLSFAVYWDSGTGAGFYEMGFSGPGGERIYLSPPLSPGNEFHTVAAPTAGAWVLRAHPMGPVVAQAWTIDITVEGLSEMPPQPLVVTSGCA